ELMKAVLDDATAMLPEAKRTSTMKAEIASHILACAAKGERDPIALRMEAPLESVRRLQAGLQSFLSMRRIEARRKNASAFRLRFSQSLASLRQRLSQAMVRCRVRNWRGAGPCGWARLQFLPIRTTREVFPQAAHPTRFCGRVMCRLGHGGHFHAYVAAPGKGWIFQSQYSTSTP